MQHPHELLFAACQRTRVMPFGWHRFLDRAGRQCYKWRIATVIKVDKNQRKLKVRLFSLHTVPLDKHQSQD